MGSLFFDHIFCFCEPPATSEAETSSKEGFTLTDEKCHSGQGTSNRCIIFEENYLEFIFINKLDDALTNPLRLDRRANWKETQFSPFGIGLRGNISDEEMENFWVYRPPYWPDGKIYIHKSNENAPNLPLFFVIPSAKKPSELFGLHSNLLKHKTHSTQINSIHLTGPNYNDSRFPNVDNIQFASADTPILNIEIDGSFSNQVIINDKMTFEKSK